MIKLKDIPELQENLVTIAYTGAVLSNLFNLDSPSITKFRRVKEDFGKAEVRYMALFRGGDGSAVTFSLAFSKYGKPLAMIIRGFLDGKLSEDAIGFFQYEYQEYNKEGVLELIRELPVPLLQEVLHA